MIFKNRFGNILIVVLFTMALVYPQSGGNFVVQKSVISGGGGQASSGVYSVDSTISQAVGGTMSSGGSFGVGGGFWGGGTDAASGFTVSGRVLTPDGRGLVNAKVTISNQGISRRVTTSSFGFYSFDNVSAGQSYLIKISSKLYLFTSRSLIVNNNLMGEDFIGAE